MKKRPNTFTVEIDPPGKAWIGVERGKMIAISLGVGKVYTAPIEFVYAALARKHARENPTGKKRPENMVPLYRLEKDMILTAKFAIRRGGISSPVFVTLAQNAFKIARHAKEHPTGKRRRGFFTSSEQMRKYRMEHQGGL